MDGGTPRSSRDSRSLAIFRRMARRRWVTAAFAAIGVTTLALVGGTAAVMWGGDLSRTDRLGAEAALGAGAGLVLALVGGLVALAAFADATRRPALDVELSIPGQRPGDLSVRVRRPGADPEAYLGLIANRYFQPALLTVSVRNDGDSPARSPAVRLQFVGVLPKREQKGWLAVPVKGEGDHALQWDGPTETIHAHWARALPAINLEGAWLTSRDPQIDLALVAEEFDPTNSTHHIRPEA